MKKITLSLLSFFFFFALFAQQDVAPVNPDANPTVVQTRALFDLEFQEDVGANGAIGVNGNAGVIFFNNEYWISEWASNSIHVLDVDRNFVETFTITGVSGTRSFTTDGTNIYIGAAGSSIFEIDPATRTLTNTISITTTSDAAARMCTYDPMLDGGNGGFWIGNFGSDIASVDMSGNELSVIPAATHGTVAYGGAIDNVSDDGPWLWVHDQGPAGGQDLIVQIDPSTGIPTGVVYDYLFDALPGTATVLAGGLFITDELVPDQTSFLGLCQATPSDQIFVLELEEELGIEDNALAQVSVYPNPASEVINVKAPASVEIQGAVLYDILGKQVSNNMVNGTMNISDLARGVYMLQVQTSAGTLTQKVVKK